MRPNSIFSSRITIYVLSAAGAISVLNISTVFARDERSSPSITVTNYFYFPVNQTLHIQPSEEWLSQLSETPSSCSAGAVIDGAGLWVHVDLAAGASATWAFEKAPGLRLTDDSDLPGAVVRESFASGLPSVVEVKDGHTVRLFDLKLVEITQDFERFTNRPAVQRAAVAEYLASDLQQLPAFTLKKKTHSNLATTLAYSGRVDKGNSYRLDVLYHITAPADVTIEVALTPLSDSYPRGYLALAKFLPARKNEAASIRWKGDIQPLVWQGHSPDRQARTHHWSRDVNWLCLADGQEVSSLLADYTVNMTRLIDGIYVPVNDFMVNELVLGTPDGWYMISEFSRSNFIRGYVKESYVIPEPDETQTVRFRCIRRTKADPESVDREFIAWAGYRDIQSRKGEVKVDLGVPYAEFGTSYFPHSTIGENFQHWKTKNLDGNRWWPVHSTAWEHAKDDIRRDMMIANALGLKWIRIHLHGSGSHRDRYPHSQEQPWQMDYLDFMVKVARETGLYIFLDTAVSPETAAVIARRYSDTVRFFEIQNEVLLFGIDVENHLPYWKAFREQVKQHSDINVVLTGGPVFYSLHERIDKLAMELDAIGQHCYTDRREAPKSFADYALSLGGYASRRGKIPLNSELNWRMITRETLRQQADHFEEIFEAFLSQQAVPLVLQFQYQETFCVPPVSRGALRHYEILHFDRTLKPQGRVYRDLVRKYGNPNAPTNTLDITLEPQRIVPGQMLTASFVFTNTGRQAIEVKTDSILPEGLRAIDAETTVFTVQPQEAYVLKRRIHADPDIRPGRYHLFEKVTLGENVFFGWGVLSYTHQPPMVMDSEVLPKVSYEPSVDAINTIDLSAVGAVIFGKEAPALEVDWAIYLYETLRSASGADILRFSDTDPEAQKLLKRGNLILVGNAQSNRLIAELVQSGAVKHSAKQKGAGYVQVAANPHSPTHQLLLISGDGPEAVQKAASDFLFRYWRHAKDAITFRVGVDADDYDIPHVPDPIEQTPQDEPLDITLPDHVRVGQPVRISVFRIAEPPVPAAGRTVWAIRDGRTTLLGTTDSTGEVHGTFEHAGRYIIRIDQDSRQTATLEVCN